ncbi:MAG: hypothetical protein RLZZ292_3778 [Bacteroidota bacterium]|jgi:hypothetical protein
MNTTKTLLALLLCTNFFTLTFGQKFGKAEVNFSDPFQIDSSDYFIIPKLIDNDQQQVYGKGKGYIPWGNYSDILFYNSKTNQLVGEYSNDNIPDNSNWRIPYKS